MKIVAACTENDNFYSFHIFRLYRKNNPTKFDFVVSIIFSIHIENDKKNYCEISGISRNVSGQYHDMSNNSNNFYRMWYLILV